MVPNKLRSILLLLTAAVSFACSDSPTQVTSDIEDRVRRSNDFTPGDCDISLVPQDLVAVGDTVFLHLQYQDCSNGNYYFPSYPITNYVTSENSGVASIYSFGGDYHYVVGVTAGDTHLRGFVGPNGQYKRVALTVHTARALTTLYSSPSSISNYTGTTQQLSITGKDQYGVAFATGTVSYSTGNSAVATVSSTGLVSLVGPGSTTITATSGSVSVYVSVTASLPTPGISGSIVSGSGYGKLDWDAVPGATEYVVSATYFYTQCFDDWGCFEFSNGTYYYTVSSTTFTHERPYAAVLNPGDPRGEFTIFIVKAKNSSYYSPYSNTVTMAWDY